MKPKVPPVLSAVRMVLVFSLSFFPLQSASAGLDDAYDYATQAESNADEAYDLASEAADADTLEDAQVYARQAMDAAEASKDAASNAQSEIDSIR